MLTVTNTVSVAPHLWISLSGNSVFAAGVDEVRGGRSPSPEGRRRTLVRSPPLAAVIIYFGQLTGTTSVSKSVAGNGRCRYRIKTIQLLKFDRPTIALARLAGSV